MAAKKTIARKGAAKKPVVKSDAKSAAKNAVKAPAKAAAKTPAKGLSKPSVKAPAKAAAKKAPQSMPYEQGKWAHVYTRAPGEQRFWLIKSEPDVFSFDDLLAAPAQTTCWDSIRNTGARNFLRDAMKQGDLALYYHSNADPSAIVGICQVVREGYPDQTAFDPKHAYYDADSVRATPTWYMVDVKAVRALDRPVTLPEIKNDPVLRESALIKVSRLSVVPITKVEWDVVLKLGS